MRYKEKIAAMTTTRTVVGYAADSREQTFTTTRTNAMADVTAPVQAEQIIKQGIAGWALVLDGAGAIISEHGDVPALRLLGLPVGTPFTVRGRPYTAVGDSANGYAYNGVDGARYDVLAFAGSGRVVRVRFDARTSVIIDNLKV